MLMCLKLPPGILEIDDNEHKLETHPKLSSLTLSVLFGSEVAFNNPSDCFLSHLHQQEFKYTLMLRDLQLLRLVLNRLLQPLNFMTSSQSDLHT